MRTNRGITQKGCMGSRAPKAPFDPFRAMAGDYSVRVGFLKCSGRRAGAFHFVFLIFSVMPYHQGQNQLKCLPPESGRARDPHIFFNNLVFLCFFIWFIISFSDFP